MASHGDDAEGKFLIDYVESGILPTNPFQVMDPDGVGALVRLAVEQGRQADPDIEMGICGEHGGDPESIGFCERIGLDYVSASPFRVPWRARRPPRPAGKHRARPLDAPGGGRD